MVDAYINLMYAMGLMNVVITQMKKIVVRVRRAIALIFWMDYE